MTNLRLAYFGTPTFSAHLLEKIIQDTDIPVQVVCVITQPDKPVGRTGELTPSPVAQVALQHAIPIIHALDAEELQSHSPDLALVFAYGKIIPTTVLQVAQHGFWNIHPSLLPKYRGASPCAYALMMGDEVTGCSLMSMDAEMDHGPIIAQRQYRVDRYETNETLLARMTDVGFELFKEYVTQLARGELAVSALPVQNDSIATFTRMLKRDDGFIELSLIKKALAKERITTEELPPVMRNYLSQNAVMAFPIMYAPFIVYNMFRGLHPWPGIWTRVEVAGTGNDAATNGGITHDRRLKITGLELVNDELRIRTVQLEGKNEVTFEQFAQAYPTVFSGIL